MSSTALNPGPTPLRWTVTEFHRLSELGLFKGRRCMLLKGTIWEQHHNDPADPAPRPVKFTRDEYRWMAEQGVFYGRRVQLIRGEVFEMSPMLEPHVSGVALTQYALQAAFGAGHFVRTQAPLDAGTPSDPEPDVAVVPGGPRTYTQAPPASATLLVVEVADSTLYFDTTTKAELYATAGIKDYWVLDVENRRLHVFRDPQPLPDGGASYHDHRTLGPADTVSPLAVPSASLRVSDLLP